MPILTIDNYRKTKNLLAGVYEVRQAPWWLPSGISESDVLAAYQFKGAVSETYALQNIKNSATYSLSKIGTPVWDSANGFTIPAVANTGLNNNDIGLISSVAVRFSDLNTTSNDVVGLIGSHELNLIMAKGCTAPGGAYTYYKTPTCSTNYQSGGIVASHKIGNGYGNGVLICNPNSSTHSPVIYVNGIQQTVSAYDWNYADNFFRVTIGQTYRKYKNDPAWGTIKIQAVAFYNVILNASQAVEITEKMNAI